MDILVCSPALVCFISSPGLSTRFIYGITCFGSLKFDYTMQTSHTLILIQFNEQKKTRTFLEGATVAAALEGTSSMANILL